MSLPMSASGRQPRCRVVYLASAAGTVEKFLSGHLRYLRQCGYDVTVVSSASDELTETARACGAQAIPVEIPREIALAKDLSALIRLCSIFRRIRPHVVNAGTPKAGFLGMLAAKITGVPVRIYTLLGLRLETCHGWKRRILGLTEKLAAACAQRVVAISPSLGQAFFNAGFCSPHKLYDRIVSNHGVDTQTFAPRRMSAPVAKLRQNLGLQPDAPVIGFVGRLTRDKGIGELAAAFRRVQQRIPAAQLLLIGDFEAGDPVSQEVRRELERNPRVILTGAVPDTSIYYNLMDVFAFPSYREGLPNAPLEAAATEVPTVGFAATGTIDAVVHGKTGWLVPVGDSAALAERLVHYLEHPAERVAHGQAGRARAVLDFCPEIIYAQFEELYRELLTERGLLTMAEISGNERVTPSRAA